MKKLVLHYSYSDYECSCEVNIPFLYESAEQFIVDLEEAHKEYEIVRKTLEDAYARLLESKNSTRSEFSDYYAEIKKARDAVNEIDGRFFKILPFNVSDYPAGDYKDEIKIYELEEWFNIFAQKRDGV